MREKTVAEKAAIKTGTTIAVLNRVPDVVAGLAPGAALRVFYRKGSKTAGLDMNRDSIWAIAEKLDMRPLGLVGIDKTWSAFRLRRAVA